MTTYQITGSPDYPGTLLSLIEESGTFTLVNSSTNGAVITSIHFETEVTPTVADASQYVSFTLGDKTLPQGNALDFASQDTWLADSPAPKNGVGPGEHLSFTLNQPYSGRIGFHVQSIGETAQSATYIATVPEPGVGILLGAGVAMMCRLKNR